jgi:hypothetical protein
MKPAPQLISRDVVENVGWFAQCLVPPINLESGLLVRHLAAAVFFDEGIVTEDLPQ